jgi:carbonic anhydrase
MSKRTRWILTHLVVLSVYSFVVLIYLWSHGMIHGRTTRPRSADECLAALKQGNERFRRDQRRFGNLHLGRLAETAGGLFVVRIAGNVCADHESASIEYAVDHLETPLVVILGHTRCGAVTAVVEHLVLEGHIPHLTEHIEPAFRDAEAARPGESHTELIDDTVRFHVAREVEELLRLSPEVRARVQAGKVKVVGAVYDVATGRVDWLTDQLRTQGATAPRDR